MINKFATIGIVIAIMAITIAIFQNSIRPNIDTTDTTQSTKSYTSKIFSKSFDLLIGHEAKESVANNQAFDAVTYTYMGLGLLALILGIISFLRKESYRFSGVAAGLGVVAIGWEFVVLALGVAVLIAVILAVISQT